MIDALYAASKAGVPVDCVVRGVCTLRPGVPGLSENIRVRSILGRFLEHSRIYEFGGGRRPEIWIGSADLMRRNIERRVESLVKVSSAQHRAYLAEILDISMADTTSTWWLNGDGTWARHHRGENEEPLVDLQSHLVGTRRWRTIDD